MSASTYLVLDIETVPDRDLFTPPEPAPGAERGPPPPGSDRSLPPLYASRPVTLGVMELAEDLSLQRLDTIGDGQDEVAMLQELADLMERRRPHLVTWHGRGFDLPILVLRSLRHGLSWPWYYRERDYRYRYSEEGHLDLCDFLSDHGATRMTSLDGAARLIGLPGKEGVDGSQVEGLWSSGQLDALKRYCLSDVVQTAFLFLRQRLLVGRIDRSSYRRAAEALLAAVAVDDRLGGLAGRVDRRRLLLAPA